MDINRVIITGEETIVAAMQRMDGFGGRVLCITEGKKLKGVVSEGDIRRWILAGGELSEKVAKIANFSPTVLTVDDKNAAMELMRKRKFKGMPVVDEDGNLVKCYFWDEDSANERSEELKDIPVVMMAGGMGTRLYPYTRILPKPLIPVGDKPIAEIIMDKFYEIGCETCYMVVNHKKNMIKAYFNEIEKPYSVKYADEEQPLGTGGGIRLLKDEIKSTFILTNCDILIDHDFTGIYRHHKEHNNAVTMVCSLRNFQISYGVVEFGEDGLITAMKEKPEYSFFTNTGSYIVEPEVMNYIKDNENIGFPDIIERLKADGKRVGVYPISENAWMDMGQLEELSKMEQKLDAKKN